MDDLISRQAAINTVLSIRQKCDTNDIDEYRDILVECFEVLPTAEPNEEEAFEAGYTKAQMELKDAYKPKKGRDICMEVRYHCEFKCSLCGAEIQIIEGMDGFDFEVFNYCPNCGARMEE